MKTFAAALAVVLIPFALGCAGDKVTALATDRITVSPSAGAATLAAGESSTININVTRPIGYDGPLTLTANNMPSGVTGTFSPSTLEPDQSTSALNLTADANAPNGTGSIIVQASGTGLETQSATISLTVGENTSVGAFSIAVAPVAITVSKGGSASAAVGIIRVGGFAGAVSLAISGFPGGIFATVSPGSTSGSNANISINVDNSVAAGTYTATVSAVADGAPPQSATLSLTVMPAIRE